MPAASIPTRCISRPRRNDGQFLRCQSRLAYYQMANRGCETLSVPLSSRWIRRIRICDRGLSPETIAPLGVGCCVSDKSLMRQRILIPIRNEHGDLIAYAAVDPANRAGQRVPTKTFRHPNFRKCACSSTCSTCSKVCSRTAGPARASCHHSQGYFGVTGRAYYGTVSSESTAPRLS
jgi:hypothetical protein